MDIVSYGVASQAASGSRKTDKDILGVGVTGTYTSVKERLDEIDIDISSAHALADKMIVQDAVNIMKAHAKLNAIAKATKYEMHNMIFDDLLDLSGIDTAKSSGYTHDAVNGSLEAKSNCVIEAKSIVTNNPSKAVLAVEESSYTGNVVPLMTGYTAPIGKVEYSGAHLVYGGYSYYHYHIFGTGEFNFINNGRGWISYEFVSPKKIQRYSLESHGWSLERSPKSWRFEAWNGVAWIVLDEKLNQPAWLGNEVRTFNVINNKKYLKYRINLLDSIGGGHLHLKRMKMMEKENEIKGKYFISTDGSVSWSEITPGELFYFRQLEKLASNEVRIKAELPSGTQLLNYAVTWA